MHLHVSTVETITSFPPDVLSTGIRPLSQWFLQLCSLFGTRLWKDWPVNIFYLYRPHFIEFTYPTQVQITASFTIKIRPRLLITFVERENDVLDWPGVQEHPRQPNVGISLAVLLAQRWQMTMAGRHIAHRADFKLQANGWFDLSTTSPAYANVMPTIPL